MATLPFLTREEQDRQNRMNMMMAANERRVLPDAHVYPEGAVPIGPNNAPPMTLDELRQQQRALDELRQQEDLKYIEETKKFEQTRNKFEADYARLNMGNEMVGKSTMTDLAQGLMPLVDKISKKRFPTEMPQTQNPLAPTFNAMQNASGTSSVPINPEYTGASTGEFGVPTEPPSAGFNPFFGVGIDPRSPSSTTNVPPIGSAVGEGGGSQLVPQEITPKPQQGFDGQLPMPDMAIPMDQGTDQAVQNLSDLEKAGAPTKVVEQLKEEANDVIKSKDPYRWNNFFANAAIAFNTLRDPRMRDADLTKVMSERIKTNRALYQASRTAEYFADKDPQIAQMIANGTLSAKDALTYYLNSQKGNKTEAFRTRLAVAADLGLTPGTPEYKSVISGGKASDPSKSLFERRSAIRNDFNKLDATKDFSKQSKAMERIVASAKDPSAAGDLALIFNYMKMLDPGSVVRESEFRTAEGARAWFGEYKGNKIPSIFLKYILKAQTGEMLLPSQRQDFVGRAEEIYDQAEAGYTSLEDQYKAIARDEEIYDGKQKIFVDYRYKGERFKRPEVGDIRYGANNKRYRFNGGDLNDEKNWEPLDAE